MNKDVVLAVIVIVIAIAFGYSAYVFLVRKDDEEKIRAVKEWLLFCVVKMESIYGSSTGRIKVRAAWDFAIERFPFLSAMVTFEEFSGWVDEALEEMKTLLENTSIKFLVDNNKI